MTASDNLTKRFVVALRDAYGQPMSGDVQRAAATQFLVAASHAASGQDTPVVSAARSMWPWEETAAGSPILQTKSQGHVLGATLLNGYAAAAAIDQPAPENVRPEAASFAATVGAGTMTNASLADAIHAFALGCEAQTRLAHALTAASATRWDLSAVCAPMGGAITSFLLWGLSEDISRTSLGIAAAQLLGHRVTSGTGLWPYLIGKGSANGVHAALLAQAGISGQDAVLEHPRGFLAVLALSGANVDDLADNVGAQWRWNPPDVPATDKDGDALSRFADSEDRVIARLATALGDAPADVSLSEVIAQDLEGAK